MISLLLSWLMAALSLLLADRLFSGVRLQGGIVSALWIAAIFAVLRFLLGWLLFGILGIATLGLGFIFHFVTQLVVAAVVLKLTSALSTRFAIDGFLPALGAAVLMALAGEVARLVAP